MLLENDSNIKVIYNKVLNKKWFLTPSAKPSHPWFNDDSITVFLAVGRLVKKKDYPTMIKAFQIASSQSNNIRLLILGDGPERNKLENLIENAQLKNKIELLGHIQDPHPIIIIHSDIYFHQYPKECPVLLLKHWVPHVKSLAQTAQAVLMKFYPEANMVKSLR